MPTAANDSWPLILAQDSVFDIIETMTARFETEGKWRIASSNQFVLGKTAFFYVKSSLHNPETFRVPEFNQSPSEISIPLRCRWCFQKVYLALAWSRIDERQLTPCQCLSQSKLEPCRPVFPILSIQNVTSTSFCHSLISYHHGKNGDVTENSWA